MTKTDAHPTKTGAVKRLNSYVIVNDNHHEEWVLIAGYPHAVRHPSHVRWGYRLGYGSLFQPAETAPHLSDKTSGLLFTRRWFYAALVAAWRLGDSNSQGDLLKRRRSTPQCAMAHQQDCASHPGVTLAVYPPAILFPPTVTTKQPALTTQ